MLINKHIIFPKGQTGTLVYRQKFVPKKKVFTLNLSRISWYGLFYQVYMLTNFVISSRIPCALITDLILGNSGFGNLVKLLNLRWPFTVMIIFYIFDCKTTKLKFHQVSLHWYEYKIWYLVDF